MTDKGVVELLNELAELGVFFCIPGNFEWSVQQCVDAVMYKQETGRSAIEEFHLAADDLGMRGQDLGGSDVAIARRMVAGDCLWPPDDHPSRMLQDALARFEYKQTYDYRRGVANAYIANPTVRKRIFKRDGYECQQCGARDKLAIDHIVPVVKGGGNEDTNLQLLCISCNSTKGVR